MSEFGREFSALRESGTFTLRGTQIIVEITPMEEMKTKSGLIIATNSDHRGGNSVNAHKLEYGTVLIVGQGTWDDDKREYVPLDVKPGQVVILPQFSHQPISTWPTLQRPLANKISLVSANSILGFFNSPDDFAKAQAVMNERE